MNPAKVSRNRLRNLTDLPNIGPAMARDLRLLGFERPDQLVGQNPQTLYDRLCELTGARQDPLRAGCFHIRDPVHGRGRAQAVVVLHAGKKVLAANRARMTLLARL